MLLLHPKTLLIDTLTFLFLYTKLYGVNIGGSSTQPVFGVPFVVAATWLLTAAATRRPSAARSLAASPTMRPA